MAFGATGALMLGPKIDPLTTLSAASDPSGDRAIPDPILWCAAADAQGNLVMGTGHSGTVLQLGARGELTVLARLGEPEVTAILVSRRGEIFAATSPNGAIYVLRKGKEAEVFYEPEERYIWSLAEDEAGNLFAGTGEKGKIFRITPKGDGSLFFDSPEPHITALAFGRDGALIAGSDGSGKVYRIDAQKTAKVLYDSNYTEISDLAVDGSGRIYASAVSGGVGEIPAPAPRLVVRSPEGEGPLLAPEDVTSPQPDATVRPREREAMQAELEGVLPGGQPRARAREGGGAIFRILPDGKVEDLWRSSEEVPYTLAVSGEGALFAGTGEPARLLKIEEKGRALALARFPQDQLTALALDPSDRLYAVTSNAGGAYRLSRDLADTGSYVSPVRDAGSGARWGRVRWDATVAAGQKVEIQTRSGNSSVPDETWSPWSPDYSDPEGSEIISPCGTFHPVESQVDQAPAGAILARSQVGERQLPAAQPRSQDPGAAAAGLERDLPGGPTGCGGRGRSLDQGHRHGSARAIPAGGAGRSGGLRQTKTRRKSESRAARQPQPDRRLARRGSRQRPAGLPGSCSSGTARRAGRPSAPRSPTRPAPSTKQPGPKGGTGSRRS